MQSNPFLFIILAVLTCLVTCAQQPTKPKTAAYYFEKGEEALANQSYKTALAHFSECLRLDPYHYEAYQSRAIAREHLGDTKGALNDFNIYLESKPENTEALFSRAVLRFQFNQWAVAREDFLKLLKMPGGETNTIIYQTNREGGGTNKLLTAQGNLKPTILNYLGLIDTKMKNYRQAITYFDSALMMNKQNPDALVNRGLAKQWIGDTTAAAQDFREALSFDSENSLARHNLAIISAGEGGNPNQSIQLLSEAIEKNPQLSYSYSERGYLYLKMGNLKYALTDYNKAIELDPNDADYFLNRGIIRDKLKDAKGALEDYGKAINLREDHEKVWLNRGNLLVRMNRLTEAIEDYTVAIRYYTDYGLAYYNRALAFQKLNKLKEACTDLKKAEELGVKVEAKVKTKICQ